MKTSGFKKTFALLMVFCMTLILSACQSSTSVTYSVDTGDKIKVSVDTQTGFRQNTGNPYIISKDDTEYIQGAFGGADTYELYKSYIDMSDTAELLEEGEQDGNPYIFYTVYASEDGGDTEYDYIVRIAGSDTCALLASTHSEDGAREAFDALSFEAEP